MLQRDKEAGYDQGDTGPGLTSPTLNAFLSFRSIVSSAFWLCVMEKLTLSHLKEGHCYKVTRVSGKVMAV